MRSGCPWAYGIITNGRDLQNNCMSHMELLSPPGASSDITEPTLVIRRPMTRGQDSLLSLHEGRPANLSIANTISVD